MWQVNDWQDIPGLINKSHADHIKKTAQQLPSKSKVIEIGCMWGKSTWCWLDNLSPDAQLITIDNFMFEDCNNLPVAIINTYKGSDEIFEYSQMHGCKKTWQTVISQHPNNNISQLFVMDSLDFITSDHFDCVYLDGDHTYDHLSQELKKFEPICDIICGDDYCPHHPDVICAVDEMIENTGRTLNANILDHSNFWSTQPKH